MLTLPRGSAHEIAFALQMLKKGEHVSPFLDFWREKVSEQELSDDYGTACGPFLLVGETVVSRQPDSGTESCSVPLFFNLRNRSSMEKGTGAQ